MFCQWLQVFGMNSKYEALITAFLAPKNLTGLFHAASLLGDPCPAASVAAVVLSDCVFSPPHMFEFTRVFMYGLQRSGINSSDVEILTLTNVTEEDAGEYICKVSNYIGEASQSGWLTVIPGNH